jgi:hypothetical protein
MQISRIVLGCVQAIILWPVVVVIAGLVLRRQIASLLEGLRTLMGRVKRVYSFGISSEVSELLLNEATAVPQIEAPIAADMELSVSSGAYSTGFRAITVAVGIANPTEQPDQIVNWTKSAGCLGGRVLW